MALFLFGNGIHIYHPDGEELAFGKLLVVHFLTEVACALLLTLVVAMSPAELTFAKRAITVAAIVILTAAIYENPYWNWYGCQSHSLFAHASG